MTLSEDLNTTLCELPAMEKAEEIDMVLTFCIDQSYKVSTLGVAQNIVPNLQISQCLKNNCYDLEPKDGDQTCCVGIENKLNVPNRDPGSSEPSINQDSELGSDVAILEPYKRENSCHTAAQVSVPFFIAGVGTIAAGLMLGLVQLWPVFEEVSLLFILVPALLGLKGNLDMCLAARLSTQVHLGTLTTRSNIWNQVIANIAIVQVQAIVAALLVSIFAVTVGAIIEGVFEWNIALLLATAGIITATTSCFVLDFVLISVVLISHRLRLNPDNLATPLAASIGDLVSITVLANVASLLFIYYETLWWVLLLILIIYLLLLPVWITLVIKYEHTRHVLTSGWVPVLSALFISALGGLVLDQVVSVFAGYVVFQPIVNGIGGNLVSVRASRISTSLHRSAVPGQLPPKTKLCQTPCAALCCGAPQARTSRILLMLALPGHLVFALIADLVYSGGTLGVNLVFMITYLFVSMLQVAILLYMAYWLVHLMWLWKIDPDNSSIPYLTAIGDLLGSTLLALGFWFLHSVGKEYQV